MARKEELYELSYQTGATRKDGWIDIEGGAGTLFSFSSKGRRELPDARVLLDGPVEPLSKSGSFIGQHIYTPLRGAAVHINAFNFPDLFWPTVWASIAALVATVVLYNVRTRQLHRHRPYLDLWEWLLWTGLITFSLLLVGALFVFDFFLVLATAIVGVATLVWVRFRRFPPIIAAYERQLARQRYLSRQRASDPEATIRRRGGGRRQRRRR